MINIAFRYRYRGQNIKKCILQSSSYKQPYECKKGKDTFMQLDF